MAGTKVDKGAIVNNVFSNPYTVYVILGVVTVGAVWLFLPGIYSGIKDAGKKAFTDLKAGADTLVDETFVEVSSIIGPGSDLPNQGLVNTVQQTVAPGGRGLSDIWDATLGRVFN